MKPHKGLRFYHSRVINWDKDKSPALYEVTRIAQGRVYYRNVIDEGIPGSERLGGSECCNLENFAKVCKEPQTK